MYDAQSVIYVLDSRNIIVIDMYTRVNHINKQCSQLDILSICKVDSPRASGALYEHY